MTTLPTYHLPLPWQESQWNQMVRIAKEERLPQALLITGQQGVGKALFAEAVAKLLLCQGRGRSQDQAACHQCKSCNLFDKASHPDLQRITPEKEGAAIKIDQIRQLIDVMNQTSQRQGYKVVLIYPAEVMNRAASNALLKIVEEPPVKRSLFILVSHQPNLILATIRSRCRQLNFKTPTEAQATAWLARALPDIEDPGFYLKISHNAPLAVIDRYQANLGQEIKALFADLRSIITRESDPIHMAKKWSAMDRDTLFHMFQLWISDLIRSFFQSSDPSEASLRPGPHPSPHK